MDKIEKIRQFVKELQQYFISIQPKDCSLELIKSYAGYAYLDKVLSFLDTLSEEPDKSLEEEISRTYHNGSVTDTEDIDHIAYENISRHFAKWGAEHLRDSTKMIDKSLEEAAENIYKVPFGTRAEDFIAGAEWQKERDEMSKVNYEGARAVYDNTVQHLQEKIDEKYELGKKDMKQQMLKDAVEGVVCYGSKGAYIETDFLGEYDTDVYGNPGDKVRIVVLKEEEE